MLSEAEASLRAIVINYYCGRDASAALSMTFFCCISLLRANLENHYLLLLLLTLLLPLAAARAQTSGCTDPRATNYNAAATLNDGSCQYPATTTALVTKAPLDAAVPESSGLQLHQPGALDLQRQRQPAGAVSGRFDHGQRAAAGAPSAISATWTGKTLPPTRSTSTWAISAITPATGATCGCCGC